MNYVLINLYFDVKWPCFLLVGGGGIKLRLWRQFIRYHSDPKLKNSNNETKQKMVVLRIFKKQFLLWYEFHGALKRTNPACFETITDCLLFSLKYTFIIKFSYHHFFWKCWINNNFYFLKETMDEEVPRTGLLISKSEITKE